jgi:hypothetical protein
MDRISCLAYLLFQSEDEKIKNAAIKMVCGDLTLKEARADDSLLPHLETAELAWKKKAFHQEEVCRFVEEFIYVS